MELSSVITDPFDWPATMPELRTIDNLLRCGICCEFLNIAMILPKCSHNYCSQCIRRFMNYKSQCPACNTPTIEGEIRNNKVVDEVVKNFILVRPAILKLCKGQGGQRSTTGPDAVTPARRRKDETKLSKSAERASSLTPGTALAVKEATKYFTSETPKRPTVEPSTSTTPLNRSNEGNISPPRIGSTAGDDEDDDDVIVIDEVPPPRILPRALTSPGTSKEEDSKVLATRSDKSDCPVCGIAVAVKYINSHLDGCLKRCTEQPRNPTKQRKERRKPLPKLVCNIMSDKELRKKLKEYKLATQGTRKELIRRMQEYTVLFNAQCDSDDPVPVEDVIKYHERMEKIRTKPLQKSSSKSFKLKVEKGQDEETIMKSQKDYLKHHSKQFEDLIKNARERMKKAKLPNMDEATAANSVSSTTEPAAEGTCSKSNIEQGASSVERIGSRTSGDLTTDQSEALPNPDEDETCNRPSENDVESNLDENTASTDQKEMPTSAVDQSEHGRGEKMDILEVASCSTETTTNDSNLIQSEKSGNEAIEKDVHLYVPNDEETPEEESSVEEPHSPTLFDNYSFSDEDFQEERRDTGHVMGQSSTIIESDAKLIDNHKRELSEARTDVEQSKCHQSPSKWNSNGSSSVGHLISPSDLQTSPVFNGGIYTDKTPMVDTTLHNSAPANLSLDMDQMQTNPDRGDRLSSRGRLRRKRKTVLEQLDVELSNHTEGEPTRRASKRNKKSLN